MNGKKLVAALRKKLRITKDKELRRLLGVSHVMLINWRRRSVTPRMISDLISRLVKSQLEGRAVVEELISNSSAASQRDLANKLGITNQAVQNWKNRRAVTARQVAGIVRTASNAARQSLRQKAIRPLVEFFPISRSPTSASGLKFELFGTLDRKGKEHTYLSGLKAELGKHRGVYVFYDSRGQGIYAGKARQQSLWKEMNLAFNRERDSVQKVRRVKHPSRKQKYKTTEEKTRQIRERAVLLHDLAGYFSAYEVEDGLIGDVESLLVRSFANDLLNKRMERFGQQRAVSAAKKAKKKHG